MFIGDFVMVGYDSLIFFHSHSDQRELQRSTSSFCGESTDTSTQKCLHVGKYLKHFQR